MTTKEYDELVSDIDREINRKRFNFSADRKNIQKFLTTQDFGETMAMLPKHRRGE